MITPERIDHVCLWVSSLDDAKVYYEMVFGFNCHLRENKQDTLVVESEHVHFFLQQYTEASPFIKQQHISFQVENLGEVIQALKSLGIDDYKTGEVDFFINHNYKWCEWRDNDGIRLECIERK